MKNYKFKSTFLMLTLSSMLFFSCSDNQEGDVKEVEPSAEEIEQLAQLKTIEITLNSNDKMQFDKPEITVYEGQTVILTLVHTGTMPITAMGHNFVLLTKGTSLSDFSKEAMKAKDNDYIPTDESNVIAYTKMIGGGEKTSVTFEAPEKGTYDFLCSFPGHYSIMKGKFIVK